MTRAPTAPTRLGKLLSLDETRAVAVAEIVAEFRDAGTLPAAATELGVGERTLKRWVADYPRLAAAIEAVRCEAPAAPVDPEEETV